MSDIDSSSVSSDESYNQDQNLENTEEDYDAKKENNTNSKNDVDMNDNNYSAYINSISSFDLDFIIFISGVLSGGLLGYIIAGGTLIFSLNLLFQKYIKNVEISNHIILLIYILFFIGFNFNCFSYRILPSCEIGYNLAQSVSNMNIDAKRASLFSISLNLLFIYNTFGMNVIIFNCFYRSFDDYFTSSISELERKFTDVYDKLVLHIYDPQSH